MNRICWWLIGGLSQMLDPAERVAVEGDLLESRASGPVALRDVLGLVVRRQLALWKAWQPWLALLGVAGIAALVLSAVAFNLRVGIDHRLVRYLQAGTYHQENGVTVGQEMVFVLSLALALFAWTWTSCFVLAALSRRALWLTGLIFYIVVLDSFLARLVVSDGISAKYPIIGDRTYPLPVVFLAFLLPFSPSKLLFLVAALWGARSGMKRGVLRLWQAAGWAVSVVVVTAMVMWTGGWYEQSHSLILPWIGTTPESWRGGVWHSGPWPTHLLPLLLVSWPAVYMLAISWERRNQMGISSGGRSK